MINLIRKKALRLIINLRVFTTKYQSSTSPLYQTINQISKNQFNLTNYINKTRKLMQQPPQKEERHPWRLEEDNLIVDLVRMHGTKKWTLIAEVLREKVHNSSRNGKQCRERWHNHLDPMVRKSPWNESEEFVFIEAHKLHGNKWAEIAKMIPGRTDNAIKNHFYSTLRKLISRIQKDEIPPEMKFDQQIRKHTTYLSKYLKTLLIQNSKILPDFSQNPHHSVALSIQSGFSANARLSTSNEHFQYSSSIMGMDIGSNDLYVIKKLRESEITLARIDAYLASVYHNVVKGDINRQDSDREVSQFLSQSPSSQTTIKQDRTYPLKNESQRQSAQNSGDAAIVGLDLNGITNARMQQKIDSDKNQRLINSNYNPEQTTRFQQTMSLSSMNNTLVTINQETEKLGTFRNIQQQDYKISMTQMPKNQRSDEEEKMNQQLQTLPQNFIINNAQGQKGIYESAPGMSMKIEKSLNSFQQQSKGGKPSQLLQENDGSEFENFINEGDILVIEELKLKSEQLLREYNEAKELELDQRKRQQERTSYKSPYQITNQRAGQQTSVSPISTLALAAAAATQGSQYNLFSQDLSVSQPNRSRCQIGLPVRQSSNQVLRSRSPVDHHSFQTIGSMQEGSGLTIVEYPANNHNRRGLSLKNQAAMQCQQVHINDNQNQASRNNYYNCQMPPSFSQQSIDQQIIQLPQAYDGFVTQTAGPQYYQAIDQYPQQHQLVTINGERYLLSQNQSMAAAISNDRPRDEIIQQQNHALNINSSGIQTGAAAIGNQSKFLNSIQGQQFLYIPITQSTMVPQGHQENANQYIQNRDQQHNQVQGAAIGNTERFQISSGMQMIRPSLQPQPLLANPSGNSQPVNQNAWRMINQQSHNSLQHQEALKSIIPRTTNIQNSNSVLSSSYNDKLQEQVQNQTKIDDKNNEIGKAATQIIKPQLIRYEQQAPNQQTVFQRQFSSGQESSSSQSQVKQIIMVPTIGINNGVSTGPNKQSFASFRQPSTPSNQLKEISTPNRSISDHQSFISFNQTMMMNQIGIQNSQVIQSNSSKNQAEIQNNISGNVRHHQDIITMQQPRSGISQNYNQVILNSSYQRSDNNSGTQEQKE